MLGRDSSTNRVAPLGRLLEEAGILYEIAIILGLVLANAVLAGAEIAVVSLRRTRLQELVEEGGRSALAVQQLREDPERFLATVQIGITVVGATAGAFGGATLAKDLEPLVRQLPLMQPYAEEVAFAIVVAIVSYLSLVVGELVPKSLALRTAERYSLLIGRPLLWLSSIAKPLVWLLTASSNGVLRLFGDKTSFTESRLSQDELQQLVEEAAKAGTLHAHAGRIASRALEFGDLTAADVMVPRNRVAALPRAASRDEIRRILLEQGHTRMPVYEGNIDNVVGYISIKDVLAVAWEEKLFILQDLLRPPFFVAESMKAVELLQAMQQRRQPFAIVVDEQGGVAGIVAVEDLLEELVGEMFSEHARNVPEPMTRSADGSVLIAGGTPVRDINRELDLGLPEGGEWTTIAGLCLELAGRIPVAGDELTTKDGIRIEIVDASPRRVRTVRVRSKTSSRPAGAIR